ncbi:hypothetical protein C8R44DRAFT_873281 [Mycena epipterygia]|nr:hypothetical protein C8R44DRAFT_873281 [Mycena epipterygia]
MTVISAVILALVTQIHVLVNTINHIMHILSPTENRAQQDTTYNVFERDEDGGLRRDLLSNWTIPGVTASQFFAARTFRHVAASRILTAGAFRRWVVLIRAREHQSPTSPLLETKEMIEYEII